MPDPIKNTPVQSTSVNTTTPISGTLSPRSLSPVHRALAIVGGVLVLALIGLSFFGGYVVGENKAEAQVERFAFNKRQLTENLDKPINERPLLQQLPDRIKRGFKEHGLRGNIVEIEGDHMVVDTPQGARSVALASETKIFRGGEKETASRDDLKVGTSVMVLSKQKPDQTQPGGEPAPLPSDGEISAVVIIIDPPMPPQEPQGMQPGQQPLGQPQGFQAEPF